MPTLEVAEQIDFGICCHSITPSYLKHKINVLAACKLLRSKIVFEQG